jgi:MFS family permease
MEAQYPKYRWFVLIVMIIATIGQGLVLIAPSPMIQSIYVSIYGTPEHADGAGAFAGLVSLMLMVSFTLCVVIGGIVGGVIADKIGLAKTYITSLILMIAGSAIFIIAGNNIGLLIVARILGGLGAGPVIATEAKLASEWFPVRQRPIVIGLGGAALSAGIAVGLNAGQGIYMGTGAQQVFYLQNIVSGAIDNANKIFDPTSVDPALLAQNRLVRVIEGGNWNIAIGVLGVVCIVGLILSIIWLKGPKPPQVDESIDIAAASKGESAFKLAARSGAFFAGIAACFCASWIQQAVNDLTPNHLGDTFIGLGWGAANGGAVLSFFSIAYLFGSIASGILLSTLFKGKARLLNPIAFIIAAATIAVLLLPQFINPDPSHPGLPPAALIVAMIVSGFFMGMPMASTQSFISINYPESIAGRVGGVSMGLGIVGGTVGVAVGSGALAATGNYNVSVIIVAVICVIGAVGSIPLKRPKAFSGE